jgi:hypothetical protein
MILSLLSKISVYSRVGHRSLVLVVFIGGVTFAEIAALRFLSAQVCVVPFVSQFSDAYSKLILRCFHRHQNSLRYLWHVFS